MANPHAIRRATLFVLCILAGTVVAQERIPVVPVPGDTEPAASLWFQGGEPTVTYCEGRPGLKSDLDGKTIHSPFPYSEEARLQWSPVRAKALAVGDRHAALLIGSRIFTWGFNEQGQLGDGQVRNTLWYEDEDNAKLPPVTVQGIPPAIDVQAAGDHALAVCDDGVERSVWIWGRLCMRVQVASPVRIPLPTGRPVAVSSANSHLMILMEDGNVYGGGNDAYGESSASGRYTMGGWPACWPPRRIEGLPGKVRAVECGNGFTLAQLENGEVWGWGDLRDGLLGHVRDFNRPLPPIRIPRLDDAQSLRCGPRYTMMLRDGSAHLVGDQWMPSDEDPGGVTEDAVHPKVLQIPGPGRVEEVATGRVWRLTEQGFVLARETDGRRRLYTFWPNEARKLLSENPNATVPFQVYDFPDVQRFAVGRHTLLVLTPGASRP